MTSITIPSWNALGLIPPINAESPTDSNRSPYTVSLKDLIIHFATSPERRDILQGFLNYRRALHEMGLDSGFQWLDGSFMENVEALENRPPNDMDVVSFLNIPKNFAPSTEDLLIFNPVIAKERFKVDAYTVEMNLMPPEQVISRSAYWYSMWSHRRNQAWKGFLKIDLNPSEDAEATAWLERTNLKGTW